MILHLLVDVPEDVSARINTLTVYVPDWIHLKLKEKNSTLCLVFGWEDEENHKTENE